LVAVKCIGEKRRVNKMVRIDSEKIVITERRIEFTQGERSNGKHLIFNMVPGIVEGEKKELINGVFIADYVVPEIRKVYGMFMWYDDSEPFFASLTYALKDNKAISEENRLLEKEDAKASDFLELVGSVVTMKKEDKEYEREKWNDWKDTVKTYTFPIIKKEEVGD